ncbi:MAG: hypothetical protein IPJ53_02385 [Saprospiraceae bacterium]|nr:hypothetical protein [Candidatus Vicinibacter affinis]
MKNLFLLSFSILFISLFSCCKKETTSTGQIIFYGNCCHDKYSVTIDGQTKTYEATEVPPPPPCGSINSYSANFILPVGKYTFTWTNTDDNKTYSGTNSVTITENGCIMIDWQ